MVGGPSPPTIACKSGQGGSRAGPHSFEVRESASWSVPRRRECLPTTVVPIDGKHADGVAITLRILGLFLHVENLGCQLPLH
jgi:hypothetical protein